MILIKPFERLWLIVIINYKFKVYSVSYGNVDCSVFIEYYYAWYLYCVQVLIMLKYVFSFSINKH